MVVKIVREEIRERIERIRRNEVPGGYKKTKLGVIPDNWSVCQMKECLERVENPVKVLEEEEYTQIGIRSHGKGLFYKEPVTGKELGKKKVYWIEPDCFIVNIVFAWEQAVGKTTEKERGMIGSHRFPMYRPINKCLDLDYLCNYFFTQRGKNIMEFASPGGAGRNRTLGQERFMKSLICVPPISEQRNISIVLNLIEKKLSLLEELIEVKIKQKEWFLLNFISGSKRLNGYSEKWKKACLKNLLKESKKQAAPDINKRITVRLNLRGVEKRIIKTVEKEDATTQYVRKAGQFIYGKQNLYKGAFGIVPDKLDGYQSSSDIPSFDVSPEVDVRWIYYYFSRSNFYESLEKISTGTGSKRVHPEEFLKIEISVPCMDEQKAIIRLLEVADKEIDLLEQQLQNYKQEKQSIMQLLLTGIVRVTELDGI